MDDYVAKEFPFIVTRVNTISKSLVHRIGDDLVAGKGFSATANFIRQAYMTTYMNQHRKYVALANLRRRRREALFPGVDNGDFPAFGEFEDRLGFNGSFPSEHYLRDIWHKWFSEIPVVRVRRTRRQTYFKIAPPGCVGEQKRPYWFQHRVTYVMFPL